MSAFSDVMSAVRRVVLIEDRVERLAADFERLDAAHRETRERLIRVEVIIDQAMRGYEPRRLS